jgi:UDP-N-acetylmuramoyl-tripeptide--D-alanyl-D-alanine ligase
MARIMMTLTQAAQHLHASLVGPGEHTFLQVATDSRRIKPGDLFVALRGPHFDGHDFVEQALAQGAIGAIVDRLYPSTKVRPVIVVEDTTSALGQLAYAWRQQMRVKILAITGSSGKTTVKEMLATILRQAFGDEAVLATGGNFNNHIGLPLTLLSLRASHRFAVIEMGMSDFGEIRYLTHLAKPDVAMVNNAQAAHLEALGSVEGVARAKAEIFEGLSEKGIAIINNDEPLADIWRQAARAFTPLTFGLTQADVQAKDISLQPLGSRWELIVQKSAVPVQLNVPGLHNVQNALAAATMASTCGLSALQIAQGLAQFTGVKSRLNQKKAFNGAVLIDDTYNANPGSIKAAIDVLMQFPAPRLLILGDIGEVGEEAAQIHRRLGIYAKEKGVELLLTLGENMRFAAIAFEGEHFTQIDALIMRAREVMPSNSTVLVKGSRFMRMERVVAALEVAA